MQHSERTHTAAPRQNMSNDACTVTGCRGASLAHGAVGRRARMSSHLLLVGCALEGCCAADDRWQHHARQMVVAVSRDPSVDDATWRTCPLAAAGSNQPVHGWVHRLQNAGCC